jgi:hypothetical protein
LIACLQGVGEAPRQRRQGVDVAERRRIGGARLGRRQPVADQHVEARVRQRPVVGRQPHHVLGALRASRRLEAAFGEARLRRRAEAAQAIIDAHAAPVGEFALLEDGDHRAGRRQRRQRHAAKTRLIGFDELGAAGKPDGCNRDERHDKGATHAGRPRAAWRRCLARLPQTSISHQRRRLFFVSS